MKKFLNYILVAGVAVFGLVAGANALTKNPTDVRNEIDAALNNVTNITVKADGNLSTEANLVKELVSGQSVVSVPEGYYIEPTVDTANNTVQYKVMQKATASDKDDVQIGAVTTKAIPVVFDATEIANLNETATDAIDAYEEALDNASAIELNGLEYVKFAISKKAAGISSELAKVTAASGKLSTKVIETTKGTFEVYVKYGNTYIAKKDIAVSLAASPEWLVPKGTADDAVEALITNQIKTLGSFETLTVKYDVKTYGATVTVDIKKTSDAAEVDSIVFTVKESDKVVADTTFTRTENGVTVSTKANVPADTKLVVTKVTEGLEDIAKLIGKTTDQFLVYDISLVNAKNEKVVVDGAQYTVTVALGKDYVGKKLAAYYVTAENKLEEHTIEVDAEGNATFKTDHFSKYIITEVLETNADGTIKNPNTVDNAASFAFIGVIGLVGMAASALFLNKRN